MSSQNKISYIANAGQALVGTFRVPGDKSMSHRSIMLGALAEGETQVSGFLEGEDSLATLQAFKDMGVEIERPAPNEVTIQGVGLHGLKAPQRPLDLGNSGTAMRLMVGLLAAQSFDSELVGDESLSGRPMRRVINPLADMGAQIDSTEGGRPPLKIKGGKTLTAIDYTLPMASAQVKSCVLLAGLYAQGETKVTEPAPTRDHTERMLRGFGYDVQSEGLNCSLKSGGTLRGSVVDIPADVSSAAFFMVAASIIPGSDITLEHVGINPTRDGVIRILKGMGADIELMNEREVGGEPVADIRVKHAPLQGVVIPQALVPSAIDEFPVLFVAATQAQGETVLTGAEELRVKESDRIVAMADGLKNCGVETEVLPDGIKIQGGQTIQGGKIDSLGDHRIAMSFVVAAQVAAGTITIRDCANVATSFPNFLSLAKETGMSLEQVDG